MYDHFERTRNMHKTMRNSVSLSTQYSEKNNFTYDVIILIRNDLKLHKPLNIKKYDLDVVNFCGNYRLFDYPSTDDRGYAEYDLFLFSKTKNIQKITEFFPSKSNPTDLIVRKHLSGKTSFRAYIEDTLKLPCKPTQNYKMYFEYHIVRSPIGFRAKIRTFLDNIKSKILVTYKVRGK